MNKLLTKGDKQSRSVDLERVTLFINKILLKVTPAVNDWKLAFLSAALLPINILKEFPDTGKNVIT